MLKYIPLVLILECNINSTIQNLEDDVKKCIEIIYRTVFKMQDYSRYSSCEEIETLFPSLLIFTESLCYSAE